MQQWEGQNPLVVKDHQRPSVQRQWAKAFWTLPKKQPESLDGEAGGNPNYAEPEIDDETQTTEED